MILWVSCSGLVALSALKHRRLVMRWLYASACETMSQFFHSCLLNAWTYFDEAHRDYLLSGPRDATEIFKVMDSKVKVVQR